MVAEATNSADREQRFGELVFGYLQSAENGHPADRRRLIDDNPEFAADLEQFLGDLDGVGRLTTSLRAVLPGDPFAHGALGDFRIIREVGRGGMGVVYEAEQISLNRRVALKVLPFAATMDPRQLQRFRNEAQAAACLHHPHIVPVHGVGVERGVHYYAMQLIEGQTLAQVISQIREEFHHRDTEDTEKREKTVPVSSLCSLCLCGKKSSFFRAVAELIAHAADALEYAHSMGVVHRDIKPANLMLDFSPLPASGRGAGGEGSHLWITDFGLAKMLSPAVHGGEITMTGDVIGTLRYMSPEQALAKHGLVDHRTDVYSLGATLYELLTLRPAVQGDDKQELLKHIAFEEPTPLRRIDKSIPAELETITLKSLAKEPGERYATAGEFAEDLRRWLGDRAIAAKPPGVRERVGKWGRRHKYLMGSAAAVTGVAVVALGVSTGLLLKKERETQAAYKQAQENLRVARDAADKMLPELVESLADIPRMEKQREALLNQSLQIYKAFLREYGNDRAVQVEAASAHRRAGEIHNYIGQFAEAEAECREAIRLILTTHNNNRLDSELLRQLGLSQLTLGLTLQSTDRMKEAETIFRGAVTSLELLSNNSDGSDDDRVHLARGHCNLCVALINIGRLDEAETQCRRAIQLIDQLAPTVRRESRARKTCAISHLNLVAILDHLGRTDDAAAELPRALELFEAMVAEFPRSGQCRYGLASIYRTLNLILRDCEAPTNSRHSEMPASALLPVYRRLGGRETLGRKAFDMFLSVVADFPHAVGHRPWLRNARDDLVWHLLDLARSQERLAADHQGPRSRFHKLLAGYRIKEAVAVQRRVIDLFQDLLDRNPGDSFFIAELAHEKCELGRTLRETGPRNEAERFIREARAEMKQLIDRTGVDQKHRSHLGWIEWNLAWLLIRHPSAVPRESREAIQVATSATENSPNERDTWWTLGMAHYRNGSWREAVAALDKSMEIAKGGDAWEWFFLAMANWQLGCHDEARNWYQKGVVYLEKSSSLRTELRDYRAEAAELLGIKDQPKTKEPNGSNPPATEKKE